MGDSAGPEVLFGDVFGDELVARLRNEDCGEIGNGLVDNDGTRAAAGWNPAFFASTFVSLDGLWVTGRDKLGREIGW